MLVPRLRTGDQLTFGVTDKEGILTLESCLGRLMSKTTEKEIFRSLQHKKICRHPGADSSNGILKKRNI